ncbi:MAG: DNA-binding ferritin-like protein (Dps family) [Alteromonadaceae bacterium]|jgi:DNA-binding ferritin-like protein (Dps family)|tara:strand:- start:4028 stop:4315 length:288 start_codon:yes stop_codon:yes gene_type:complete
MKEIVVVHDFLVSEAVVGDWEGQEEDVAEKMNEIYHTLYDLAEEDISVEVLTQLLDLVWDTWIGQDVLPDLETDDIYDWCRHVLENREQHLQDEN